MKCRKYTECKNQRVAKTNKGKPIFLSEWEVCDSKKLRFIKEQEASGLLSSWGLRKSLYKIPILGDILFQKYKMNEIANKCLLAWKKFMPEMHLMQPGFTYIACGLFTKNKERIQKFK